MTLLGLHSMDPKYSITKEQANFHSNGRTWTCYLEFNIINNFLCKEKILTLISFVPKRSQDIHVLTLKRTLQIHAITICITDGISKMELIVRFHHNVPHQFFLIGKLHVQLLGFEPKTSPSTHTEEQVLFEPELIGHKVTHCSP